MDGLWSIPCDVPRIAYDEEAEGDIRTFGTGTLSGYGVGGDTHMLGPGRFSGDNHDHEDINWNGLGSIGPISMSGNTIHEDHCGDLTKVMSPNGICCVCDLGCGSFMYRSSSSGLNSSTRRQSMGGHLADVLSKVSASDFPRLDFESDQSNAGAAESWMKLMGLKMSAVSMDVSEFWECTEQEVCGKYDLYLRTPPMARGRVQVSALLKPRFQLIERFFRPIVFDSISRATEKMAVNAGMLGVSQVIFAVFVEAGPGSRADREQTLLRVQCPVGLNKKRTLDSLFDWRFNLDRLLRMKLNVPDPSLQITTLLTIVERLTSRDPLFRHRLHTVITENNLHGLVRQRQNFGILVVSCG